MYYLFVPFFRPVDVFCYGLQYKRALKKEETDKITGEFEAKNNKRSELFKKAKEAEDNQRIFFQLVESFMENAPQLLLQMYILARNISVSQEITLEGK